MLYVRVFLFHSPAKAFAGFPISCSVLFSLPKWTKRFYVQFGKKATISGQIDFETFHSSSSFQRTQKTSFIFIGCMNKELDENCFFGGRSEFTWLFIAYPDFRSYSWCQQERNLIGFAPSSCSRLSFHRNFCRFAWKMKDNFIARRFELFAFLQVPLSGKTHGTLWKKWNPRRMSTGIRNVASFIVPFTFVAVALIQPSPHPLIPSRGFHFQFRTAENKTKKLPAHRAAAETRTKY